MTNFEKIKQMSVEEMARFLYWLKNTYCDDDFCKIGKSGQCFCFEDEKICLCGLKQWLESEADNE